MDDGEDIDFGSGNSRDIPEIDASGKRQFPKLQMIFEKFRAITIFTREILQRLKFDPTKTLAHLNCFKIIKKLKDILFVSQATIKNSAELLTEYFIFLDETFPDLMKQSFSLSGILNKVKKNEMVVNLTQTIGHCSIPLLVFLNSFDSAYVDIQGEIIKDYITKQEWLQLPQIISRGGAE